jgi:adenine-specific DNA-methyltransferase
MKNDKMKFETPNLTAENVKKLSELFPGVVAEGKVNVDLLRSYVGEEIFKDEAYEFTWVGKRAAIAEAGRPIRKTLRPVVGDETTPTGADTSGKPYCSSSSRDWDTTENLYIEGDNLDVLKLLQESYLNKVKMIYIDPPYNTGNDFIYRDDLVQSREEYNEEAGVYDEDGNRLFKNTETNGRFHSDWCSMIYPRLVLARNLLRDDGVIFISIDDNEVAQLRKVCDEVFGEVNFMAQITVLNNPKGRSQDKYVATCHEFLLCYSKSVLPKGAVSIEKTDDDIKSDYSLEDENGAYRELELRNTHREFGKHNRPNLYYPIYVYDNGKVAIMPVSQGVPVYPIWEDGFAGCWTWGQNKAIDNADLLTAKKVKGSWKIYRKSYSTQEDGNVKKQLKSIWIDKRFHTEKGQVVCNELFETKEKLFQSPKSVDLITELIKMSQASDSDIVLDFFSGSATTAHAVMQLNAEDGGKRKFIMVQLPEVCAEGTEAAKAGYKNICEIGKERIRRAGDKIKAEIENANAQLKISEEPKKVPDIGFRVLKLDSTNMNDVYYAAGDYTQDMLSMMESNIKPDRTDMDLLFGCLLDWGLPLSMPHTHEKIDGFTVHTYNGGDLIACFEEHVPESVVREMARRKPLRAVFRDSGFISSPEKINVFEIFKLLAPNTTVRVI